MTAFVDTSALYALLVGTEAAHETVHREFGRLAATPGNLLTTSYVLVETTALLQHRIGLAAVRDLDQPVVPLLAVRWVDEALHRHGMRRLTRADRRRLSLVDCVSFETMERDAIGTALAVDDHFAEAGFRVVPTEKRG